MKKSFTRFEQNLRDKLEGHEMPYEHSSWVALQRQMGMAKGGSSVWIVSLISTVLVLSGGAIALYQQQHTPSHAKAASTESRFETTTGLITKGKSHFSKIGDNQILAATSIGNSESATAINTPENQKLIIQSNPDFTLSETSLNGNSSSIQTLEAGQKNSIKADNIIEFACNVRKACQGEEVEFQTTNGPKTGSYLWNFGDGHFSDDVNPKHKFAKAGNYDVSLSITSDNGQINTTVVNDMITIEDAPDADFTWEFINSDPNSPEVRVVNLTEGGSIFEWSNGMESKTISDGVTFKLQNSGRQMIALNAKNQAGCADGAVKHISINADFNLGAPKQWSIADGAFMPQGLKKGKVDFEMEIFDQSGIKIFSTSSRVKGWDGKLPNGTSASSGSSFSYRVVMSNDRSQELKYFNGTFIVFP
jgi:PKD repeat protein